MSQIYWSKIHPCETPSSHTVSSRLSSGTHSLYFLQHKGHTHCFQTHDPQVSLRYSCRTEVHCVVLHIMPCSYWRKAVYFPSIFCDVFPVQWWVNLEHYICRVPFKYHYFKFVCLSVQVRSRYVKICHSPFSYASMSAIINTASVQTVDDVVYYFLMYVHWLLPFVKALPFTIPSRFSFRKSVMV